MRTDTGMIRLTRDRVIYSGEMDIKRDLHMHFTSISILTRLKIEVTERIIERVLRESLNLYQFKQEKKKPDVPELIMRHRISYHRVTHMNQ